ncbi:unnamed protein product [Cunninghamella blakesleeana]
MKVSRSKFDIIGRKVKGSTGKPTLSKQLGEDNRKKTLLVEMKNKNRIGGIVDKRFGENNPNLTPEERMLERFTRERQRSARTATSLFNLEDEDDLNLTHYGQSLADIDDFDDTGLALSDDEDNGQLDKSIVEKMHFGGFDDDQNDENDQSDRPKSKNEIMKEIIAKSKLHKYERQMAKQEDDDIRADLDEELNDIRSLLDTNKRKPLPSQSNLFARAENEKKLLDEEEDNKKKVDDSYEDYDKALRELAFDRRAQATDRTKTEEEIALEEKEKLEKAERARKRRMEGLDSESEDEDHKHHHNKKQRKKAGAPQGDDLDDDYYEELEEEESKKLGTGLTLEDIQSGKYSLDDDLDDGEESEEESEESEESEEEDDDDEESDIDDLEGDEVPHFDEDEDMNILGQDGKIVKSSNKKSSKVSTKESSGEIPYTFECPLTHGEFLSIMEGLKAEDALTVIKRIRILYHVKISPENKQKISSFLGVVVDHLGYVASTISPLPTELLESLCEHIFEMAQQVSDAASDIFISKIKKMHHDMSQKIRLTGNNKKDKSLSSCLPDVEDITILRSLGQVFSTSDLNHLVATPASLFMAQALAQCPIQTELDIGRGIFLTQLFLEYQAVAKRFVPEALNFLQLILVLLSPKSVFKKSIIPGLFPLSENHSFSLHIKDIKMDDVEHIPTITLDQFVVEDDENNNNDQLKLSLLQATLRILEKYLQLYASTPALIEVFEPILLLINEIQSLEWHEELKTLITTLQERLQRQVKFCKEKRLKTPLRMQQHRPIPIAQHLPKFEKAYSMDRHYDPDHERNAMAKLQAQLKKEKKGAMRELRKDNMFIARENAKIKKQKDEDYNKYVKGVMSILEGDQAEKNRLEREKKHK